MAVIIDKRADKSILNKLTELNVQFYKSTSIDFLYEPVDTHPDMQIHFIDKKTAVCAPCVYEYYKSVLPENITLIKGYSDPERTYPGDCTYNITKIGKNIIGNLPYIDKKITKLYSDLGYEFIHVKQGYTKCNLCIVDSNSVITEDDGLFKTLTALGIDVLKISSGEVLLKNFKNGFIGGASGFLSESTIGFLGSLTQHSDYGKIKSFITDRNINVQELSQNKLNDYGSLLYFEG